MKTIIEIIGYFPVMLIILTGIYGIIKAHMARGYNISRQTNKLIKQLIKIIAYNEDNGN